MQLTINQLDTDFAAPAVAAAMIENDEVGMDQVVIVPRGASGRPYSKEIESISNYNSEHKRKSCIRIEINKEGLYDMLPEGLFHSPPISGNLSEEEMIDDIRLRRTEEREARLFFSVIEAEINHMRVISALYENRLDKRDAYNELFGLLNSGWEEFNWLSNEQSRVFAHLLAVIHQQRNNLPFIEEALRLMINKTVRLSWVIGKLKTSDKIEHPEVKLGQCSLGINTVITGDLIEYAEKLHVEIGPMDPAEALSFVPGSHNDRVIQMIFSYFLPADTIFETDIQVAPELQKGVIGYLSDNACLGYTVFL
jgi:type VI secretion system protein ImpH